MGEAVGSRGCGAAYYLVEFAETAGSRTIDMDKFFSDLKRVLGLRVLKRLGRRVLEDCLALAG